MNSKDHQETNDRFEIVVEEVPRDPLEEQSSNAQDNIDVFAIVEHRDFIESIKTYRMIFDQVKPDNQLLKQLLEINGNITDKTIDPSIMAEPFEVDIHFMAASAIKKLIRTMIENKEFEKIVEALEEAWYHHQEWPIPYATKKHEKIGEMASIIRDVCRDDHKAKEMIAERVLSEWTFIETENDISCFKNIIQAS